MKEVNEELEGNTPVWDSNLGRWIEPTEVLDQGSDAAAVDMRQRAQNLQKLAARRIYEQRDWLPIPDIEQRDIGGNYIEDRIEANLDRYKDGPEHD